eukprot:GFYU01006449.1.p1 GENE.GFYU01006449.1~~GFYU01006449.1.p1  ORF type:complete len:263 (-),score=23.30 GFYU01006449.1:136-855(-)
MSKDRAAATAAKAAVARCNACVTSTLAVPAQYDANLGGPLSPALMRGSESSSPAPSSMVSTPVITPTAPPPPPGNDAYIRLEDNASGGFYDPVTNQHVSAGEVAREYKLGPQRALRPKQRRGLVAVVVTGVAVVCLLAVVMYMTSDWDDFGEEPETNSPHPDHKAKRCRGFGSTPCGKHGHCHNNRCICVAGWVGVRCEVKQVVREDSVSSIALVTEDDSVGTQSDDGLPRLQFRGDSK